MSAALRQDVEHKAAELKLLRGDLAVLVRLLVEADKVLSTLEGESTDEQELLDNLRRQITIATIPHRPEEADLLSLRACIGA